MNKMILSVLLVSSFNAFALSNPASALTDAATLLSDADLSCNTKSDCEIVAVGSRACGGPAGFIVASKLNANIAEVKYLALASEEKGELFNDENGIISICSLALPPTTTCFKNVCTQK